MRPFCRSIYLRSRARNSRRPLEMMSCSSEQDGVLWFSQLWGAYTSQLVETHVFIDKLVLINISLNSNRMSLRNIAFVAFKNHVHDHITNMIGILRAISESIRCTTGDILIRSLMLSLKKVEEDSSLPSLNLEKEVFVNLKR